MEHPSAVGENALALMDVVLPVAILAIPLVLWRVLYPHSDWAALCLAPLAIVLFVGHRRPLASMLRAKAGAVVRHDSPAFWFATGAVRATVSSTLFVASAVSVLAWQTLEANAPEAIALLVLSAVSGGMVGYVPRMAAKHFRLPVAQHYGVSLGAAVAAMVFVPMLAWINWSAVAYPGELRSLEFREAMLFWLGERLPDRRGWIAEGLAWVYAVEAMQISWVARSGLASTWTVLYCAYLGLVGFLVARSSADVALALQGLRKRRSDGDRTQENHEGGTCARSQVGSKTASRAFWGTVAVLALGSIGVAVFVGALGQAMPPQKADVSRTKLEEWLGESARVALRDVAPLAAPLLEEAYAPVYKAIPDYADFHFSVRGEYSELGLAIVGGLEERLSADLFDGFDDRISEVEDRLYRELVYGYESALDERVRMLLADRPGAVLGDATQIALDDAVGRARATIPVAGSAAVIGSGGAKAVTAGIAKTLAGKVAAKAAAKTVAKGGAALGGAGTGTALCAWAGPVAVGCGVIGGIAAWLLADGAVITLAEVFTRADFEAELRSLVDEHKATVSRSLSLALESRATALERANEEVLSDFRLSEL